jgi:hypothetical protein
MKEELFIKGIQGLGKSLVAGRWGEAERELYATSLLSKLDASTSTLIDDTAILYGTSR